MSQPQTIESLADLQDRYRHWVQTGSDPSLDTLIVYYPEWSDEIRNEFPAIREAVAGLAESQSPSSMSDRELPFETIKAQYREQLKVGSAPSLDELSTRYPQWETSIREVLPGLDIVEQLKSRQSVPRSRGEASQGPESTTGKRPGPAPGDLIGQYRLLREIGRGGAATVFEAERAGDDQTCALKVFRQSDSPFAARFEHEANVLRQLDHDHIIPLREAGEDGGTPYLAMKLIRGVSLAEVLSKAKQTPGIDEKPFPLGNLTAIAMLGADAASALQYAHEKGVLHRDIKPANLILNFDGSIWLTDFGCAKNNDPLAPQTQTGFVVGTLKYMAPEQRSGNPTSQSDVYALALTLRELVEYSQDAAPAAQYAELIEILDRGAAEDPAQRFASAALLERALVQFICGKVAGPATRPHWVTALRWGSWVGCLTGSFFLGGYLSPLGSPPADACGDVPRVANSTTKVDAETGIAHMVARIARSRDDAEEYGAGTMYLNSTDLEMVWDEVNQHVGLRFEGVQIPAGAEILSAVIQFHSDRSDNGATDLVIRGIADSQMPTFGNEDYDLSGRETTQQAVGWTPAPWKYGQAGPEQQTPDCAAIVQELVGRPDWSTESAIGFVITGQGCRSAASRDGDGDCAELRVQYRALATP